MKKCLPVLLIMLLLSSCEKAINFNLNKTNAQIVVEASIENGQPATVFLSTSLDYFSKISPEILSKSFIHNADITISDGTTTYPLQEVGLQADGQGDSIYFYTSANYFTGELNTHYSLTIKTQNQVYTAQTTIPTLAKTIDSLWWKDAPFKEDADSGRAVIVSRVTDPPGFGNYVRYYTSVNSGPFFPGLNSVFDDQVVDGTTYDITVERGINRNETIDFNTYSFFHRGDTVVVKLANIDKATFDFWRTMEYSYQSIGNPFSSPTKVLGNISNGALGYFGGYAAQYKSIVIPPK